MEGRFDVVTGAFSFTGRYIAERLLAEEHPVKTLTNHPQRPGARELKVEVAPLQFTDREALVESLRDANVLYNTYWVRYRQRKVHFGEAVANTRILLGAAREAGVQKVVHISVSNPSEDSHLDYFAAKARAEAAVRESGIAWAIIRPTLVFGPGQILLNNMAWLLRRVPVFGIAGLGDYRVQPVAVEDVAELATWAAAQNDNVTVDAAGPDVMAYTELVEAMAIAVGRRPRFVYVSPGQLILVADLLGKYKRDVLLTRQELDGLMEELLVSHERPRGKRQFDNFLLTYATTLGLNYESEHNRHWK